MVEGICDGGDLTASVHQEPSGQATNTGLNDRRFADQLFPRCRVLRDDPPLCSTRSGGDSQFKWLLVSL